MKKNKYIIFAIAISLYFSCDSEKLDLVPDDILTQEVTFSNETTTRGALAGVYSTAQQSDVLNGTLQLSTDWMADDVDFVGSFPTLQDIKNYRTLSDNVSIAGIWDDNYEVIGGANLVIKNAPLVNDPNFTDSEKAIVVAEAKFMRALTYFNLAHLFGQPINLANGPSNLSVPLVLNPFEGEVEFPSRATIGQVYDQIELDLLDAVAVLGDSDNSVASKGAAQALLSRLYLYQGRNPEAATMATNVIDNPAYSLAADYSFYNTTLPELVFTLVNTAADGQEAIGFSDLTNPTPVGRGDAPLSPNLIAAYQAEPADKRFIDLRQTGPDALGTVRTFSAKFPDGITNADNAPVIRITEMYLNRAEANFKGGSSIGDTPLNDINRLRLRAGLTPPLGAVTLNVILDERRKELALEGHRRMDLLRNNMSLRRTGQANVSESMPAQNLTIYPIPVLQIDLNPNMQQNPGY